MHGDPDAAAEHFTKTLTLTKDPRTLAWTHIYLGRLYDIARDLSTRMSNIPSAPRPSLSTEPPWPFAMPSPTPRPLPKRASRSLSFSRSASRTTDDDTRRWTPAAKPKREAYRPSTPRDKR